jgi:hypothetical protein
VQLFNEVMCDSLENMVYHMSHPSKQDQHAVIHCLGTEGCQLVEIHWRMQAVYDNACVSKTVMKEWC